MGIFFEHAAGLQADTVARDVAGAASAKATFNSGRFFIALAIFVALLVGGLVADIGGHTASSTALYGFAGTVFGVVAAFLGTEKGSSD